MEDRDLLRRGHLPPLPGKALRLLEGGWQPGCSQRRAVVADSLAALLGDPDRVVLDRFHVLRDGRARPRHWAGQGDCDVLRAASECPELTCREPATRVSAHAGTLQGWPFVPVDREGRGAQRNRVRT